MPHVCTGTALPILRLAWDFLPIPHSLKPLSCTSNKSVRLQPNLLFQQIHSSRRTGRILIRLLRSSWVSFDQDYNLPKKCLHVQTWVSEQRFFFSSTKGDNALLWSRQPPSIVSGFPLVLHTGSNPGPLARGGFADAPHSKRWGGSRPRHFCENPPLFMHI